MLAFHVDRKKCIRCGRCVADCVAGIIQLPPGSFPAIAPDQEEDCIGCQHCLAVCPEAAVAIAGVTPADTQTVLPGAWPTPESVEALMHGRRSMRHYAPEPVDKATLDRLLAALAYSPTGVNHRRTRFTVLETPTAMTELRAAAFAALEQLDPAALSERMGWMKDLPAQWREDGTDVLFRGAPHAIVATNHRDAPCLQQDCLIALTYFEVLAQSLGLGTTWCGLAYWAIELLPGLKEKLRIPADQRLGYVLLFGHPSVQYPRTVVRTLDGDMVERLDRLG